MSDKFALFTCGIVLGLLIVPLGRLIYHALTAPSDEIPVGKERREMLVRGGHL